MLLYTVFTSILEDRMCATSLRRCAAGLRPGGVVVSCAFRDDNLSHPNIRGMSKAYRAARFPNFELPHEPGLLVRG